jgi:hypothetical protein
MATYNTKKSDDHFPHIDHLSPSLSFQCFSMSAALLGKSSFPNPVTTNQETPRCTL